MRAAVEATKEDAPPLGFEWFEATYDDPEEAKFHYEQHQFEQSL